MPYTPYHADWEDKPSTATPIGAAALNHIEEGIVEAQETAEGKADADHNHDSRYYTENEVDNMRLLRYFGMPGYSTSYVVTIGDQFEALEAWSASPTIITVPVSVGFVTGSVIEVARIGTGTVTIEAGAGVTIQSADGLVSLRAQFSCASLRYRGSNTWILSGDLA